MFLFMDEVNGLCVGDAAGCTVIFERVNVTEDARNMACNGVDNRECRKFATSEHIVTDRHFFCAENFFDTGVDAFVAASDKDEIGRAFSELLRYCLVEGSSAR